MIMPKHVCYHCGHRKEDCDCWGGGWTGYEEGYIFSEREYKEQQDLINLLQHYVELGNKAAGDLIRARQEVACLRAQLDQYIKGAI